MPLVTYVGDQSASPEIQIGPASFLVLPQGIPCEIDDQQAALLVEATPTDFVVAAPSTNKDHTP